jgi:hypothetical protein
MQHGFEGIITQPTLALIGEAGAESVSIKPGRTKQRDGGINVSLNFPNVLTMPENPEIIRRLFLPAFRQLQLDLERVH